MGNRDKQGKEPKKPKKNAALKMSAKDIAMTASNDRKKEAQAIKQRNVPNEN